MKIPDSAFDEYSSIRTSSYRILYQIMAEPLCQFSFMKRVLLST